MSTSLVTSLVTSCGPGTAFISDWGIQHTHFSYRGAAAAYASAASLRLAHDTRSTKLGRFLSIVCHGLKEKLFLGRRPDISSSHGLLAQLRAFLLSNFGPNRLQKRHSFIRGPTFRVRRSRGEMYIGHGRHVCLTVCVSVCPSSHSHTQDSARRSLRSKRA